MSVYLSPQNTAEQNFELFANSAYPMTKEYADAIEKMNSEFFETKQTACKLSTISLCILGLVTGIFFRAAAGCLVGSLIVIPISLSYIFKDKEYGYNRALSRHEDVVKDIVSAMARYILQSRNEKVAAFNTQLGKETYDAAKAIFNQMSVNWDE